MSGVVAVSSMKDDFNVNFNFVVENSFERIHF